MLSYLWYCHAFDAAAGARQRGARFMACFSLTPPLACYFIIYVDFADFDVAPHAASLSLMFSRHFSLFSLSSDFAIRAIFFCLSFSHAAVISFLFATPLMLLAVAARACCHFTIFTLSFSFAMLRYGALPLLFTLFCWCAPLFAFAITLLILFTPISDADDDAADYAIVEILIFALHTLLRMPDDAGW